MFFFLGIHISKQIAPASLFSFQLRIKTPSRKNIKDDSVFLFTEVKCKGNTQITHMEETEKRHWVIRLISSEIEKKPALFGWRKYFLNYKKIYHFWCHKSKCLSYKLKIRASEKFSFHKNLWLGNDFLVVCKLSSHFFQTCIL